LFFGILFFFSLFFSYINWFNWKRIFLCMLKTLINWIPQFAKNLLYLCFFLIFHLFHTIFLMDKLNQLVKTLLLFEKNWSKALIYFVDLKYFLMNFSFEKMIILSQLIRVSVFEWKMNDSTMKKYHSAEKLTVVNFLSENVMIHFDLLYAVYYKFMYLHLWLHWSPSTSTIESYIPRNKLKKWNLSALMIL
jgi:hypothetical protein